MMYILGATAQSTATMFVAVQYLKLADNFKFCAASTSKMLNEGNRSGNSLPKDDVMFVQALNEATFNNLCDLRLHW